MKSYFESGGMFVAEQVGVPSLCMAHFAACGDGPSDLDHAFHEFVRLRQATPEEIVGMPVVGALLAMLARMRAAAGRWDVTLSPNSCL